MCADDPAAKRQFTAQIEALNELYPLRYGIGVGGNGEAVCLVTRFKCHHFSVDYDKLHEIFGDNPNSRSLVNAHNLTSTHVMPYMYKAFSMMHSSIGD